MLETARRQAVDPTNQAAFGAWNGSEGEYWDENDELYDVGLARHDEPSLPLPPSHQQNGLLSWLRQWPHDLQSSPARTAVGGWTYRLCNQTLASLRLLPDADDC